MTLKGFFVNLYHKVRSRIYLRHCVLTYSGAALLSYCQEIVNGTLRDEQRVAAYEDEIERIKSCFVSEETGGLIPAGVVTRELVASSLVTILQQLPRQR